MKGWIEVLLPAWNLPGGKTFKKLLCLPSGITSTKLNTSEGPGGGGGGGEKLK